MPQYILSLDAGTTSSRAIVFDDKGLPLATAQKEFTQIFPQPGWVEHDALEIWTTQAAVAAEAVLKAGLQATSIAAIGITNQRETVVVWDKTTGQPVYHAIVWQDRRTATVCDGLKKSGAAQMIKEKTGLVVDAYFSATKLQWILDHVSGARDLASKGNLLFGTIDTWLLWKLTGGAVHATDVSNASRTMQFNIHSLDWDDDLLQLFNIPRSVLPQVRSSSELYGHTETILTAARIPITGIAGDQQSALFGQLCLQPGMVKNTYGTGCFMLMNTGNKPVASENNLLTTVAWKIGADVQYALEGSVFIAGAVVQWLRDGLRLIHSSGEVENLIAQSEDNGGVYMVPAFTGLGAPYWNGHARGVVVGITRGSTASHLARAAVESIAFQTADVLQAMEKDASIQVKEVKVDGGATVNNGLMQFQADVLNCRVVRPVVTETTALGAAFLAGLAVGIWKDVAALQSMWQADKTFSPGMDDAVRNNHQRQWKRAVRAAQSWTEGE